MTDEMQQNAQNSIGQNPPEAKPKRKRATQKEMLERKKRELDKLKNNTQKLVQEVERLEKRVSEHNRKKENNIKYTMADYIEKRYSEMHDGAKMFDLTYYKDRQRIEERTEAWIQELRNTRFAISDVFQAPPRLIEKQKQYIDFCRLIESKTSITIDKNITQDDICAISRELFAKTRKQYCKQPLQSLATQNLI